jgi:hypothetical protein
MSDYLIDPATLAIVRDTLVWKINESRARMVELVTLPSEMALLAAQQVNEVRLNALEAPKEVGWGDIALEMIWSLALNSTFADKVAALLLNKVFARVLRSQYALNALPKSDFANELLRDIASAKQSLSAQTFVAKTLKEAEAKLAKIPAVKALADRENALKNALDKYANLGSVKKEDLKVYAGWINEIVDPKNIVAVAKAQKDASKKGLPTKTQDIPTTEGFSTVTVMSHFYSAARAQRLHIESLHNHYELIAKTYPLSNESFLRLFDMFNINPLFDAQKEAINLEAMGGNLRLRIEAMIWAYHGGFINGKGPQPRFNAPELSDVFPAPLNGRISSYLLVRFEGVVVEYKARKGTQINWDLQSPGQKGMLLRDYFWAVTDELKLKK